ncbi:hypothetical protein [Kordiimonas sp.]|uniref:hypothetical protein n=1 Tax=Kordiimonas sp. TaxID=1970157 RepID=UPI003A90BAFA
MAKLAGDVVLSTIETEWLAATATGEPLESLGEYGLNRSQPGQARAVPRAVVFVNDSVRLSTTSVSEYWSVLVEFRVYDVGTVEIRTAKQAVLDWLSDGLRGTLAWTWPAGVELNKVEIDSDGTSKPDETTGRGVVRVRFDVGIEQ